MNFLKLFKEKHPNVNILENPVAGGGGANMLAVLMGNLESGNPPDIFRIIRATSRKVILMPAIWKKSTISGEKTNFESRINPAWVKSLKFDGKVYSVPINAHRTNWLWYNKPLFEELGLTPAGNL